MLKRSKVLSFDDPKRLECNIMTKRRKNNPAWDDATGTIVPYDYQPMTEKEAEIACSYDYEFQHDPMDNRTIKEMVDEISRIASGVDQRMINDFLRIY